jgi:GWxTD domain-containing protein
MRAIFTALIAALLFSFTPSVSQVNSDENNNMFNLDVLNFYSTEGTRSRVDVYVEIPLRNMEFKKSKTDKTNFVSKFDLNIDVIDKDKNVIYNNVSKEEVTTKTTGQEYLSQNSQILTRNLFLPPGEYDVKVSVFEQSTKRIVEQNKKIWVEDYSTLPLSISNVMIVSHIASTVGKKMITPDVARNVAAVDTFYLFYYVYRNNDDENIDVDCRIYDPEKKEVYAKKEIINVAEGSLFQNQIFMAVPTNEFGFGKYTIEITAASSNHNTTVKSYFQNESLDFPVPLKEIDLLIDQLQYVAKESEIDYIREGKTNPEKQKRFLDFWKRKDPSPNTKRNEFMQEYYIRVILANKSFSTSYTQGWRTDMGMVFIIFGQPSNVERHPYEMDSKPYEVWQYYELSRQFVFVDNSGFGDYRLITPIWETFRY